MDTFLSCTIKLFKYVQKLGCTSINESLKRVYDWILRECKKIETIMVEATVNALPSEI